MTKHRYVSKRQLHAFRFDQSATISLQREAVQIATLDYIVKCHGIYISRFDQLTTISLRVFVSFQRIQCYKNIIEECRKRGKYVYRSLRGSARRNKFHLNSTASFVCIKNTNLHTYPRLIMILLQHEIPQILTFQKLSLPCVVIER